MKHYSIAVKGYVQGVNFRRFTEALANEIGVQGYVMNHVNGSVMIHAEADEASLTKFMDRCFKGPLMAKVTSMCCEELPVEGFKGFEILKTEHC